MAVSQSSLGILPKLARLEDMSASSALLCQKELYVFTMSCLLRSLGIRQKTACSRTCLPPPRWFANCDISGLRVWQIINCPCLARCCLGINDGGGMSLLA